MTITYTDGTVLEAIVLSHEENAIRALAPGWEESLVFTRSQGTWMSEELEPVSIEFAWQRRLSSQPTAENDCICPKPLAARLIRSLLRGSDPTVAERETLFVFTPEGNRVAISLSELRLN